MDGKMTGLSKTIDMLQQTSTSSTNSQNNTTRNQNPDSVKSQTESKSSPKSFFEGGKSWYSNRYNISYKQSTPITRSHPTRNTIQSVSSIQHERIMTSTASSYAPTPTVISNQTIQSSYTASANPNRIASYHPILLNPHHSCINNNHSNSWFNNH